MYEHEQEHEVDGVGYSRNHYLIMALCCLIPIAILVALAYANIGSEYLPFLLVLLCPVLMLLMHLPGMLPRKKRAQENHQQADSERRIGTTHLSELHEAV